MDDVSVEPPPGRRVPTGKSCQAPQTPGRGKGTHVEVTANEVDVVLLHVPM